MKKLVIRFNAPVVLLFTLLSPAGPAAGRLDRRRQHHPVLLCIPIVAGGPADLCTLLRPCAGPLGYNHYMNNMLLLLLVGPGLEENTAAATC